MRRLLLATSLTLLSSMVVADTFVNGYTRHDGTYVAPHMRSQPDSYRYNNYGSQSFGGSQRDEFSAQPAYNRSNSGYGYGDNDRDGFNNSYDAYPNNRFRQ